MPLKELLMQELENIPEPLMVEVLDYLRFLKLKHAEDEEDLRDAREALVAMQSEGTVAWEDLKASIDS